ncbi:hypothetical protein AB0395_30335 [Streptosporangium sp. NPDC051023]|uniref:hypothetical protein n=1 Tax=Streptosporangium sp. NPDC051023 TaxID=3155410 RepID=UPI00344CD60E
MGLIREPGHDYAVAVLTEDSLSRDVGVTEATEAEGTARRILAAFRGERGCAIGEEPADGDSRGGAEAPPTGE